MNKSSYILIIITLFCYTSCRTAKSIHSKEIAAVISAEEKEKIEVLQQIPNAQFNFNLITAKAKVAISSKGNTQNVTFNIRMKKDEKIWISVNAIGSIEVARILLTPDSVKIIDRINNKYIVKDYVFISNLLKNEVSFFSMQDLMIGNVPLPLLVNNLRVMSNSENILLSNSVDEKKSTITLLKSTYKMLQLTVIDTFSNKNLKIDYADQRPIEGQNFPYLINSIASSEKESVKLDIQFVKVEKVSSLEFPFNIPKRFE